MYFVGIDGGGTKTRAALLDAEGNILGIGQSGPSSIETVSPDISTNNIRESIKNAINAAKLSSQIIFIKAIFAGIGDVLSLDSKVKAEKNIRNITEYVNEDTIVVIENDVYGALYGGLPLQKEGIVIIVGTGSVAFGINKNGVSHRAGGYSYKEGDPGSSFYLGRQVIKYISKAIDGRVKRTCFIDEVCDYLGIHDASSFINVCEELYVDRTKTASLAKFVTKHALKGDNIAISIIDIATDELILMIKSVIEKLSIESKNLAIIGSLGNARGFKEVFVAKLKKLDPNIRLSQSGIDPVLGSGLKSLELFGLKITDDIIEKAKKIAV